jgi:hypothetical protein
LAFCIDYRERCGAKRDVYSAYAESKGAKGWMGGLYGISGLIFGGDVAVPKGWKKERRRASDGTTWHSPHRATPEGKALLAEIAELGRMPYPDEFAERFGIPQSLSYRKDGDRHGMQRLVGAFPHTSFVGWVRDEGGFWVVLPDVDTIIAEHTADGFVCEPSGWSLPDGLERSSRARYELALAQAKVADEERAAA